MRLLLPLHTVPDLPCRRVHPGVVVAQFSTFPTVQRRREGGPALSALHNAHGTKGAKPGLHVKPPLLVVAIGELGERCRRWRHGGRCVTWRRSDGRKTGGARAKMRQAERVGSRGQPGTAGGHPGRAVERVDWRVWMSGGSQSAGLITCWLQRASDNHNGLCRALRSLIY